MPNSIKKLRKFQYIGGTLLLIIASLSIALSNCSSFGGSPSGRLLERIEASPQYRNDHFVNVVPQAPSTAAGIWDVTVTQFSGEQVRVPPAPIPVVPLAPDTFKTPAEPGLRSAWLGHASVLIELDGFRFMVDPVFSERASPLGFIGPRRFHPTPIALNALPPIDAVMISHDHYDHLDMPTIKYLSTTGTHFYIPLGVGAHLREWGVPDNQIHDMDWWETHSAGGVTITCTPSRHYSGRDLFDYKETFWSSWSITGPDHRVYYSGDSGFSDHFEQIGNRFGPFDLNIIKVGAYGPGASWHDIHMTPEQAVAAHKLLGGKRMLPVHWATFNLAQHDWDEPIKRALLAAAENQVEVITPRIGETVIAGREFNSQRWWEAIK